MPAYCQPTCASRVSEWSGNAVSALGQLPYDRVGKSFLAKHVHANFQCADPQRCGQALKRSYNVKSSLYHTDIDTHTHTNTEALTITLGSEHRKESA